MDQNWIWENKIGLSIIVILATVIYSAVRRVVHRHGVEQRCPIQNGIEILQLLRKSKPFPLAHGTIWKLHDFCHDLRIWKGHVTSDQEDPVTLYGCFSKVKGSSQVVLKTLKDLQKYPEWQPKLTCVNQITRAQEAPPLSKSKTSHNVPVQHDYISLETEVTNSRLIDILNYLSQLSRGESFVRKLININRYWHREDNGCCWLLEVPETAGDGWTFYLAQPVEEMDQCLLTVVQAASSSHRTQGAERSAYRLASLQNYFLYRKVQCTPLTAVTLPCAMEEDDVEDLDDLTPSPNLSRSMDDLFLQASCKTETSPKTETNILQKFRNLITEKKEWYEERKRKNQASVPTPDTGQTNGRTSPSRLLKEGDTDSDLSEGMDEDETDSDATYMKDLNVSNNSQPEKVTPPKSERKSLLQFLRSSTMNTQPGDDSPPGAEGPLAENQQRGSASRSSLSLNLLQRMRSSESGAGSPDGEDRGEDGDEETEEESVEEKLTAGFRTMANTVAAEIISEKFKISNIDISRSYDEQAILTGGWIYCGLEKEVVILRKMLEESAPVQSYLGKGIIPVPPKAVFEALKNPRTRFTYDEMLKKVEILHDFGGGLKIVYLYHEVSQLFRKEARDFCLLQSERIEGFKYIISMKSVGWPDCVVSDDVTRGKFHSSGWIIEPTNRDNKLYSMVTYIVQMELGTSKTNSGYLVEELAAKQPLSIAHLRAYLAPASALRAANQGNASAERKRSVPSAPMGTLAAAAAFASQGAAQGASFRRAASLDV